MTLKNGSSGQDVKDLQSNLIQLGYLDAGGADGIFGSQTQAAVTKFQNDQAAKGNTGLGTAGTAQANADGIAGSKTLAAIQNALSGGSGAPAAAAPKADVNTPSVVAKNYDANADYQEMMLAAAQAGDLPGLREAYTGRLNKVADTGNDYGLNTQVYMQQLMRDYGLQKYPDMYMDPYNDPYGSLKDQWLNKIMGMTYDQWSKTDNYKNAYNMYANNADRSMKNVYGQQAARTGGLASSYAQQVAQQQYDNTMNDFYDYARSIYNVDRNDVLESFNAINKLSDTDYSRWADQYNMFNNNRKWDLDRQGDAQTRITTFLNAGGNIKDLDQDLIDQSGLSEAELNALANKAAADAATKAAKAAKTTKTPAKTTGTAAKDATDATGLGLPGGTTGSGAGTGDGNGSKDSAYNDLLNKALIQMQSISNITGNASKADIASAMDQWEAQQDEAGVFDGWTQQDYDLYKRAVDNAIDRYVSKTHFLN